MVRRGLADGGCGHGVLGLGARPTGGGEEGLLWGGAMGRPLVPSARVAVMRPSPRGAANKGGAARGVAAGGAGVCSPGDHSPVCGMVCLGAAAGCEAAPDDDAAGSIPEFAARRASTASRCLRGCGRGWPQQDQTAAGLSAAVVRGGSAEGPCSVLCRPETDGRLGGGCAPGPNPPARWLRGSW